MERQAHVFERRGFKADEARAVGAFWRTPHAALKRIEALSKERGSDEFAAVAALLKRVKNITKDQREPQSPMADFVIRLKEPAEQVLLGEVKNLLPRIGEAEKSEQFANAMKMIVGLREPVDKFFTDVLVMAEDPQVRADRLSLLTTLRNAITQIADISEMAAEDRQA